VSIIVLTLLIRLLLLPLGIKQIKSMQAMQAIQPKVKELQRKYKGNKAKAQEETMKLYREAGVNPLGGCLPLLLQFPILIAMYSVLAPAPYQPVTVQGQAGYELSGKVHLPPDSAIFEAIVTHQEGQFLLMNLQCSLLQAGTQATLREEGGDPVQPGVQLYMDGRPVDGFVSRPALDCGETRFPAAVPYAILLAVMIGTTFYSQRQMQKASPATAQSQQQQVLLRVMPVMFGVFGLNFAAGLVLYWTMSNAIQIGQQAALLKAGHIGPDAMERRMAEARERAKSGGTRQGFMQRMQERAEAAQKERERIARSRGVGGARPDTAKGKKRPKGGGPPKRRDGR
jgi:YidC/Oxa1 family membrane protein insertase